MKTSNIKDAVREMYGSTVRQNSGCGCDRKDIHTESEFVDSASRIAGYTEQELLALPDGANLGLGCGNPVAMAVIRPGDVVLDLGSGAGIDCFLASAQVGETGRVIGVDMTPEMIERAWENARQGGYRNVEFRLGEIENLPVESGSADVVISNCVINLSPDKQTVFRGAYRVLRPGGTLLVSDIVLLEPLPHFISESVDAYIRCISGAILKAHYLGAMQEAGFGEIRVVGESRFPAELIIAQPGVLDLMKSMNIPMSEVERIAETVVSLKVAATRP